MTVIYIADRATVAQADRWKKYRSDVNPLFLAILIPVSLMFSIGVLEFSSLTYFLSFVTFIKIFCTLKIREFEKQSTNIRH